MKLLGADAKEPLDSHRLDKVPSVMDLKNISTTSLSSGTVESLVATTLTNLRKT